jgi:hypothetical protein
MSALPKAVQKKIDEANLVADAYYKQLANGGQPAPNGAAPAPTPDPNAAPAPPAADPNLVVHPTQPPNPTPDPTPPPPHSAAPAPASLPQADVEHKYKVLQGKYNAEVPRLQNMVRDLTNNVRNLTEQLSATQTLLASLGQQQAAPPAGSQPRTPAQPQKLVKDEEIKEFGADLIDVARRVAREEIAGTVEHEVARRMQPVAQRADQAVQQAAGAAQRIAQNDRQGVFDMLDRNVQKWTEINNDPAFLEWLEQVDPYAGLRRGDLLGQAFESNNGPRVVAFFNGFLKEHAIVTPPSAPAAAAPAAAAPQVPLEKLVTPGLPKTGAAGTQDGSGKRVWTRAEISKFYADQSAGRFNSDTGKQKAKEMEADIFAAQREGRVR